MKIILASSSPRRTELLNLAKIDHQVLDSHLQEVVDATLSPIEIVQSLAFQKASVVFENHQNDIVIGADTIVVIDHQIITKPKDRIDAFQMLSKLRNRKHQVITGVAILTHTTKECFYEITEVEFLDLTNEEIDYYLDHEKVYDKAGAYAIQGLACRFIKSINGDFYNVMGLPICQLTQKLKKIVNEEQNEK